MTVFSTSNTRHIVIFLPDMLPRNKHIVKCDYQISAGKGTAASVDHFCYSYRDNLVEFGCFMYSCTS